MKAPLHPIPLVDPLDALLTRVNNAVTAVVVACDCGRNDDALNHQADCNVELMRQLGLALDAVLAANGSLRTDGRRMYRIVELGAPTTEWMVATPGEIIAIPRGALVEYKP